MALFSFSTALSGLRANTESLSVTGNNIANANTAAFKSDNINFADIFHDSVNSKFNGAGQPVQVGNGVRSTGTTTNYAQGSLDDSASSTNAGIQGTGFFVVASEDGVQSYTRAGNFSISREGFLVTPNGERVQGFQAVDGVVSPDAPLAMLQIPIGQFAAPALTTEATIRMNLSASAAIGAEFHAPVQVFDSKGIAHTLDTIYTKTAGDTYTITATLDGNPAQLSADGAAAAASATATFDENGQLVLPATSLSIIPDATALDPAELPSIDINLRQTNPDGSVGASNITNYDAASAVASTDQDGFSSGTLSGVSFDGDSSGTLLAVFNNGQTRVIGQVAVATFNSQEGMSRLGNNLFGETISSGPPSVGRAGTGGRGGIVGSVLEKSNVDIATEFTDLIVAQRGFQANSRVITTINQTLQELIQII